MKCVVNTLTVACLLLVIPYSTICDKGVDKVTEGHVTNGTVQGNSSNFTVGNIRVSSREGVPVSTTQKVEVTSEKPSASTGTTIRAGGAKVTWMEGGGHPKSELHPKVSSNETENKTKSEKKDGWSDGGKVAPHHVAKSKAAEHSANSTSEQHGEDAKPTTVKPHRNIAARKGAPPDVPAVSSELHPQQEEHSEHDRPHSGPSTLSTPSVPVKRKPQFTMVRGDKFTSSSESILESPTTGKDYVFPLVLLIFAIPGTVFLVRFLYKRGTEFTERQQYHRMYLIDGMYNVR